MRICTSCNQFKDESAFYRTSKGGIAASCKECAKARARANYRRKCEGYAGPKKYDCGAAGMLTADEISRRTKVRIGTIYSRASNGVTGDALMLPKQPTRAPGAPRTDSMVTACRLTKLAHEIGRLPSVARIREARPMSRQAAERWRCALRVALDHTQANVGGER